MDYKILQDVSTSSTTYWQFVQVNDEDFTTDDAVVLEAKLIELLANIPISKLKVVSEFTITEDLTIS
jgi:hypothetical protein